MRLSLDGCSVLISGKAANEDRTIEERTGRHTGIHRSGSSQPHVQRAHSACPPQLGSSQKLSDYIDGYLNSFPVDHRPNEKTLDSYRAAIKTFIKIVGDKPLDELSTNEQGTNISNNVPSIGAKR